MPAVQEMLGYLGSLWPLEKELIADLEPILQFETVKRWKYLLEPGQVNDRLYYIHKGLLRCFYMKEEEGKPDKDVSTQFMRERDVCVSVLSFYGRAQSFEYIEVMEPCEVFSITYDQLEAIYQKYFSFNYIGRVLTVKYLMDWAKQLGIIRMLLVEERYKALGREYPWLLQRVPHKYLASFLDMSESEISRLRGR
jgi:CRP-like cAMP-binding protein